MMQEIGRKELYKLAQEEKIKYGHLYKIKPDKETLNGSYMSYHKENKNNMEASHEIHR